MALGSATPEQRLAMTRLALSLPFLKYEGMTRERPFFAPVYSIVKLLLLISERSTS
jgi:hypothetical protein